MAKVERGTISLTAIVFECPACFRQSVRETVSVYNGRDWKDADRLRRFVAMPEGIDVRLAFR